MLQCINLPKTYDHLTYKTLVFISTGIKGNIYDPVNNYK